MKGLTFLVLLSVFFTFGSFTGEASWLIDTGQFHASSHGQFSCLDCHSEIQEQKLHPDPANVNRRLEDFFNVERCFNCHDDVLDSLAKGFHGGKEIRKDEEYQYCLRCHDSHYQLSRALRLSLGDRFNPDKPLSQQCGVCHEHRTVLPELSPEDESCLACHRALEQKDARTSALCLHCHGQEGEGSAIAWQIDTAGLKSSPHGRLTCLECHPDSARYSHAAQRRQDCLVCHLPHEATVDMAAHGKVSCEACHLLGVKPVRDPDSGLILGQPDRKPGVLSRVHSLVSVSDEASCRICHHKGNAVGAAARVLPTKGIICMPCHAASFSVRNTVTIVALVIFAIGIINLVLVWAGAAFIRGKAGPGGRSFAWVLSALRTVFSVKLLLIVRALFLETLLNRRLWRQSSVRWMIHSLIFLPFVFRFTWGIIALIFSEAAGRWSVTRIMLDQDHAVTAFLFDLTGVMVIAGVVLAILRRALARSSKVPGLPRPDWIALGLMGVLVINGFSLEGMRIAMTGGPEGAGFAFVGRAISRLMADASGLTTPYVILWNIHAVLTGAFVAYLPFSRMLHIIMAPVSLAINAVSEYEKRAFKVKEEE